MPDIQKIVDTKGAAKVGGIMVDMFTASMINQIYNKVNDQNKKKMEKSNISTLVDIAQRMMQKMGDNLEEGRYSRHVKTPKIGSKEYMDNLKKSIDKTTGHLKPSKNPGLYKDGKKIKDVDAYLKSKRRKRSRTEEAVSPAQRAAIAISKKEKGEKPLEEDSFEDKSKKSGISVGTLKKVYKRGVAAWKTGHRPGTTPEQWGHARVNAFIVKKKKGNLNHDKDLA